MTSREYEKSERQTCHWHPTIQLPTFQGTLIHVLHITYDLETQANIMGGSPGDVGEESVTCKATEEL